MTSWFLLFLYQTINIDDAELEEEGDSKVEEFATMAEQIAKQGMAGMQNDSDSDSSDEEEENAESNMDILRSVCTPNVNDKTSSAWSSKSIRFE